MGRWEPNARGRLEQAAMELYGERGFERTTVAEIAARAGLTERTFYRHFTDKREVVFWGAAALQELLVAAVDDAPTSATPMEAVVSAFERAAVVVFEERRVFARRRQAIVAASVELQEREVLKLATLAGALAGALRRRGATDPAARLAAEAGVAVFRVAFEQWVGAEGDRTLAELVRAAACELAAVAAWATAAEG